MIIKKGFRVALSRKRVPTADYGFVKEARLARTGNVLRHPKNILAKRR